MSQFWKDLLVKILFMVDWKTIAKQAYELVLRPKLEEYVKSTESKWDDAMLVNLDAIVAVLLAEGLK